MLGNFQNPGNFCLWNLESRKRFLLESGILGFGIRNPALGIWNFANQSINQSINQSTHIFHYLTTQNKC